MQSEGAVALANSDSFRLLDIIAEKAMVHLGMGGHGDRRPP